MNRLNLQRRTQIINCLVEGNSIRSTERLTDTHRDTIMRLLVQDSRLSSFNRQSTLHYFY